MLDLVSRLHADEPLDLLYECVCSCRSLVQGVDPDDRSAAVIRALDDISDAVRA